MQSPVHNMEYKATNTHNKYFDTGESKNIKTTQSKLLYEGSQNDTHTHTHTNKNHTHTHTQTTTTHTQTTTTHTHTHTHTEHIIKFSLQGTVKHSFRHNSSGYSKGQRTSHIKNCTPRFVYMHILFSFTKSLRYGKTNKCSTGRNK